MLDVSTSTYMYLPPDVDRKVFDLGVDDDYMDDIYMVVRRKGKTIYCKPLAKTSSKGSAIQELIDTAFDEKGSYGAY